MRSVAGHALGILGYALILWAAFGYSWRKDPSRSGPGSMRAWMRAHVASGLLGPALVVAHTGFAFRGLAGVAAALMVVVVASGAIGRHVYTTLPQNTVAEESAKLRRLDAEILAVEEALRSAEQENEATVGAVATMVAAPVGIAYVAALEAQLATLRQLRTESAKRMEVSRTGSRRRRVAAAWWVFHVPLSMAMLVLGLLHAAAALYYAVLAG